MDENMLHAFLEGLENEELVEVYRKIKGLDEEARFERMMDGEVDAE